MVANLGGLNLSPVLMRSSHSKWIVNIFSSPFCLRRICSIISQDLQFLVVTVPTDFLRETIKEGYLSKLPPERNRVQTWHRLISWVHSTSTLYYTPLYMTFPMVFQRRYFRLVLSLNRSLNGGPVYLEYYERHRSKKPKVVHKFPVCRINRNSKHVIEDTWRRYLLKM